MSQKILIVDDDPNYCTTMSTLFKRSLSPNDSIIIETVSDYHEAKTLISTEKFDVITLNGFWPGIHAGYAYNLIPLIRKQSDSCVVIFVSSLEHHLIKGRELNAITINKNSIDESVKFDKQFQLVPMST